MNKALQISINPRPLGVIPLGFILSLPLLGLPLGGWLVESGLVTLARCSFKVFFGLPCMGCGATRATLNFLHGDWLEALYFQPFIILLYLGFFIWGALSLGFYIAGKSLDVELASWLTWTLRIVFILMPFANWAYLVAMDI